MKNLLILIVICLIYLGYNTYRPKPYTPKGNMKISIGKVKTVVPEVNISTKHRSSISNYIDSDGRSRITLSHRIRVNKKWNMNFSTGVSQRRNGNMINTFSAHINKNW